MLCAGTSRSWWEQLSTPEVSIHNSSILWPNKFVLHSNCQATFTLLVCWVKLPCRLSYFWLQLSWDHIAIGALLPATTMLYQNVSTCMMRLSKSDATLHSTTTACLLYCTLWSVLSSYTIIGSNRDRMWSFIIFVWNMATNTAKSTPPYIKYLSTYISGGIIWFVDPFTKSFGNKCLALSPLSNLAVNLGPIIAPVLVYSMLSQRLYGWSTVGQGWSNDACYMGISYVICLGSWIVAV